MKAMLLAAALIAPETATRDQMVVVRDLDLRTEADAHTAYRRLARAARRVCRGADGPSVRAYRQRRACAEAALASAVWRLDAPLVTAAYDRARRA